MITKPQLPPRAGYVEIEVGGVRQYAPTPETRAKLERERQAETLSEENKLLRQQVSALTDQNDFQEELIVELATIVYA